MNPLNIAIVGSGPAGLLAASLLSRSTQAPPIRVTLFEARKSIGRKILIAGTSGLNFSNGLPHKELVTHYPSLQSFHWDTVLKEFSPQDLKSWIESMGIKTFLGTSGRYLIKDKKSADFLKKIRDQLTASQIKFNMDHHLLDFNLDQSGQIELSFGTPKGTQIFGFDKVIFALGGGSWEDPLTPIDWPPIFTKKQIRFNPFLPSNVGYEVAWDLDFLKESEGKPLKNIALFDGKNKIQGELMITHYGLEGTPIYTLGRPGPIWIDLKPGLSKEALILKLNRPTENLSFLRRIKKTLNLSDTALSLLHFNTPDKIKNASSDEWAHWIKNFELNLLSARPLKEAISSTGGILFDELNFDLSLKKYPSIYLCGEMLDWSAPTGGFLIQGCCSQGAWVAKNIIREITKTQ